MYIIGDVGVTEAFIDIYTSCKTNAEIAADVGGGCVMHFLARASSAPHNHHLASSTTSYIMHNEE